MAKKTTKKKTKQTKKTKPAAKVARKAVRTSPRKAVRKSARKPATSGHASIAVGLTVNDVQKSIAWYRDVLGFTVGDLWKNGDVVFGAELKSGAININVTQDDWKLGRDRVKGQGVRMYIMTDSKIDQYAAAIKKRGGTLEQDPTDGWGMRVFGIIDPDGFKLTFMTVLKKKR